MSLLPVSLLPVAAVVVNPLDLCLGADVPGLAVEGGELPWSRASGKAKGEARSVDAEEERDRKREPRGPLACQIEWRLYI